MRRFRRNLRHACGIADARNHANTRREYQTNAWRRCGRCNEGVREDARGCDGREGGNPIDPVPVGGACSGNFVFHASRLSFRELLSSSFSASSSPSVSLAPSFFFTATNARIELDSMAICSEGNFPVSCRSASNHELLRERSKIKD